MENNLIKMSQVEEYFTYAVPHPFYKEDLATLIKFINSNEEMMYIRTGSNWERRRMIHLVAKSMNLSSTKEYEVNLFTYCSGYKPGDPYGCYICEYFSDLKNSNKFKNRPVRVKDCKSELIDQIAKKVGRKNISHSANFVKISKRK